MNDSPLSATFDAGINQGEVRDQHEEHAEEEDGPAGPGHHRQSNNIVGGGILRGVSHFDRATAREGGKRRCS